MKGSDAEWTSQLELTLMSCRHLKAFKIFQKLSVYAVVSIYNDELKKKEQRQKTAVDREGGGSPEWNDSTMHFDLKTISSSSSSLPSHHLYLRFDLCCEGVVFGKRAIGQVCVPLKDLIKESSGTDLTRSVSYQVRSSDRRPNGVLSFSYKVHRNNTDPGDKRTDSPVVPRGITPSGHYNQSLDHQLDVEKIQNVESPHKGRTNLYPSLHELDVEKIQNVESPYKGRTNLYPSLHDIYITPPPITCNPGTDEVMTYPEFYHYHHQIPTQEAISMLCVPASSVSGYGHGVYKNNYHPHPLTENNYHPHPLTAPFLQIVPETYQCRTESIGHGNGQSGRGGWGN